MDINHSYGFGAALLDFFLPRRCVVCDTIMAPSENLLCKECWSDLPHTYYWLLRNNPMSDRFNALIQEGLEEEWHGEPRFTGLVQNVISSSVQPGTADNSSAPCDTQAVRTERYAYAAALFFYRAESDYSKITRCIKYHGRLEVGRHFGRLLGERLAGCSLFADVDAVVPVPLHWTRRWKRGYNQAEVIAGAVALRLGVPLRCNMLRRSRRTGTQTKLGIDEKKKNVSGAFTVSRKLRPDEESPNHILIIDDVFTTGSTLHACFVALRAVYPPSVRISVATLGFAGGG